ncbi:hypothetical protein SISNIDRAFT_465842 [Sistotremastrum niveocremeum HHB9708]|uniref:Uncharacterized protein n=1 Tax=Sistotremastrum niveocremeum HHB9708 TaxID=1314777 RepID=A0A164UYX4_9AGAM|nr:hypothetical protein SISNIDRAFT_465842 [Sistotremastrum niveocremeum HHB9708]
MDANIVSPQEGTKRSLSSKDKLAESQFRRPEETEFSDGKVSRRPHKPNKASHGQQEKDFLCGNVPEQRLRDDSMMREIELLQIRYTEKTNSAGSEKLKGPRPVAFFLEDIDVERMSRDGSKDTHRVCNGARTLLKSREISHGGAKVPLLKRGTPR